MTVDPAMMPYLYAGAGAAGAAFLFAIVIWRQQLKAQTRVSDYEARITESEHAYRELERLSIEQKASLDNRSSELERNTQKLQDIDRALSEERAMRQRAEQEREVTATQMRERQIGFEKQLAQFDEQKQSLKKEFELLAHQIFEQKGKDFETQSKSNLDAVLKPFKDQIDGFQKRVNDVHTQSVQSQGRLEQQIKHVLDIGLKMSDEANTLATALKGDKKAQGGWSEVQAELLLEMAGLSEGTL